MTNSSLLELYNLEGEFDNTLLQYKKEYANYINLLNNSNHYSRSEIKTAIQTLHSINEKLISINKKRMDTIRKALTKHIITIHLTLKNNKPG